MIREGWAFMIWASWRVKVVVGLDWRWDQCVWSETWRNGGWSLSWETGCGVPDSRTKPIVCTVAHGATA